MVNLVKKYREVIAYIIFGVLTTLVNTIVFYILNKIGINTYVNNTISWIVAVVFSFVVNKVFVFQSKTKTLKEFSKEASSFVGTRLLSYFIDMGVVYVLVDILILDKMLSKIISNIIVIILNYIFSKLFVFKRN